MDQQELLRKREIFFNEITDVMFRPKSKIDSLYDIEKYLSYPIEDEMFSDVKHGELVFVIRDEYFGKNFEVMLSIWQVGTKLKIGVCMKDENQHLLNILMGDEQAEILNAFEDVQPKVRNVYGGIFYDWYFDATHLYDSYQIQETFVMNMRHIQLRVLNTIYDALKAASIQV